MRYLLSSMVFLIVLLPMRLFAQPEIEGQELKMVEWRSDASGLFSNLCRALEWMYCVKQADDYGVYINMDGAYGFSGNAFPVFFEQFQDSKITTTMPNTPFAYQTTNFPAEFVQLKIYPTDGMKYFENSKFVYQTHKLYNNPDFSLFRERLHPIILQYFKPVPQLQERIDAIAQKMNDLTKTFELNDQSPSSPPPMQKIGIHLRSAVHYVAWTPELTH